jgi:thiol-disulfide isomerase/thioredoxin
MKGGLFSIIFLFCILCAGAKHSWAQAKPQVATSVSIRTIDSLLSARRAPLILNFWATFCKPCIEEIPHFEGVVDSLRSTGLELWLVSLDMQELYPRGLAEFTRQKGFRSNQFWLNESNADYFCPFIDSSWSGAIPASLFINPSTGYRKFYEQALNPKELNLALQALLAPKR